MAIFNSNFSHYQRVKKHLTCLSVRGLLYPFCMLDSPWPSHVLIGNQPTFSWTVFPNANPKSPSVSKGGDPYTSHHYCSFSWLTARSLEKQTPWRAMKNSNSNSKPGLWCTFFCGLSFPHVLGPFNPSSPTSMDWLNGNISTWNIHETMAIFPLDQSNWGFPTWSIHPFHP